VAGRGKKVPSMSKGNDILHKLCYYLEVSPSLLDIVSNDVFLIGPCMLPFKTAYRIIYPVHLYNLILTLIQPQFKVLKRGSKATMVYVSLL